jgi:hypothetical protein
MSQVDQDAVFGRVTREYEELHRQAAALGSNIKSRANSLIEVGKQLKDNPADPRENDLEGLQVAVSELPDLIRDYRQATTEQADKKAELDGLRTLPS